MFAFLFLSLFTNVVEKLSKKSGQPQNERVEAYETEQRGLISLPYDGDFCASDTTERRFKQFRKENSANFVVTEFSEVQLRA
jgi:hypothetical protein